MLPTTRNLAVGLAIVAATEASATCYPPKQVTQFGETANHVVVFPAGTPTTSQSIVGRFWQPGQYASTNEGACDESSWLIPSGPAFSLYGFVGTAECPSGCPEGEMILLLQDAGASSSVFAVARMTESSGYALYDFSLLGVDVTLTPIPRPHVTSIQSLPGGGKRVAVSVDDPAAGFYGLPGVPPTSTITAINVYSKATTSSPPRERTAWTFRGRLPYLGGITTGTVDVPVDDFCIGGGFSVRLATALELDGGQVVTDLVSDTWAPGCLPESIVGASVVPDDSLRVTRSPSGELALGWEAACFPANALYSIYEGAIGDWTSHVPRVCGVFGTTKSFAEPAADSYYLVVPYSANTGPPGMDFEGSYGLRSDGTERDPSFAACVPQSVHTCP